VNTPQGTGPRLAAMVSAAKSYARIFVGWVAFIVAIAAVAAGIALLLTHFGQPFSSHIDHDSWTRAVLLRDAMETGSWQQVLTRDSSGDGTSIHWTRLVEVMALPFALALKPFVGVDRAILIVATVFGAVSLGCVVRAICWAARPFISWRRARLIVMAAAVMSPILVTYGGLGRFGHHLVILLCAVMVFGYAARAAMPPGNGASNAAASGLWAGIGASFSVEMMPFVIMAFGVFALLWVGSGDKETAKGMKWYASAFLAITTVAWFLDRPNGGLLSVEVDRLSLPYIVFAALLVAATCLLERFKLPASGLRLAAIGVAGLAFGGVWLALFPQFLHGIAPDTPPEVMRLVWSNIEELQPVDTPLRLVMFAFGGVVSVIVLSLELILFRGDRRERDLLLYSVLCAVALLALSVSYVRFCAYGAALGAVAIAILASRVRATGREMAAAGLGALLAVIPMQAVLANYIVTSEPRGETIKQCPTWEAAEWLKDEHGVVFAETNIAPELLWRTPAMTVASNYHRGYTGLARWLRVVRAMTDADAKAGLEAAKVHLVLLCLKPKDTRPPYVLDLPETALEKWARGEFPDWLREEHRDAAAGMRLLEVVPE
jgi:hypothetical protein